MAQFVKQLINNEVEIVDIVYTHKNLAGFGDFEMTNGMGKAYTRSHK